MKTLNKDLRAKIIKNSYEKGLGHNSSALSCVDAISYLYKEVLKEEDIFILSKGHGSMALYAVLESVGKNPKWKMHPERDERNGIYATTGSLGHGLPIALGRAYAKKINGDEGKIYVLLGDGEMEEGSVWESLILANRFNVNLNLLIDWNKYQVSGSVKEVALLDGKSLEKKLKAFGCKKAFTVDGHSLEGLSKIKTLKSGLNGVILDTIKGKGVKILEEKRPHGFNWKDHPKEYVKTLEELK